MNLHITVHMTENEIINYIKRSISDIARKCGVSDADVIKEMKELCNR